MCFIWTTDSLCIVQIKRKWIVQMRAIYTLLRLLSFEKERVINKTKNIKYTFNAHITCTTLTILTWTLPTDLSMYWRACLGFCEWANGTKQARERKTRLNIYVNCMHVGQLPLQCCCCCCCRRCLISCWDDVLIVYWLELLIVQCPERL